MLEKLEHFIGKPDSRIASYPLMDNPEKTAGIVLTYLIVVTVIGPAWMKSKRPFQLRLPMIIYNIFLVAVSTWIFTSYGMHGWFGKYSLRCQPLDLSDSEDALKMVQVSWVFYFSKVIELGDTVFFVLRKKTSQINFLHVFHHSTVPLTAWYGVNYGPVGYNTFFPIVNSFVHMWMYLYYGLSAMGPEVQKYLWWKKYLTSLQLAQFAAVIVFFGQLYFVSPQNCASSQFLIWLSLGQAIVYFLLFTNFYVNSYKKGNSNKTSPSINTLENLKQQNLGNSTIKEKLS